MSGLAERDRLRLIIAVSAADAVWDRTVFDHARSFGGAEAADALLLSGALLGRLLGVGYAAITSAAGGAVPPTGDPILDDSLDQARHDALDTFSDELLGPVPVAGKLVYGLPMLLDSPVPVGAVLLAAERPLEPAGEQLLREFLRHLDTRLTAAAHLIALRRENAELEIAAHKIRATEIPDRPAAATRRRSAPVVPAEVEDELVGEVPSFSLFGVDLPTAHFGEFCANLTDVTERYLAILDDASGLFLDIPNAVDAKADEAASAPYRRLLNVISYLRPALDLVTRVTAQDLAPAAARGGTPTFADLTRAAKQHADDPTVATLLDIMNDEGEKDEVDALYARRHPYEFRVANLGEVFAVVALHRTFTLGIPERLDAAKPTLLAVLRKYQAARAFLFAYERFADVPLRGEKRYDPVNAQSLLFRRRNAPSFNFLLRAYRGD